MLPSPWVASTKREARLVRGQGYEPLQGRGRTLALRDRGPGAGEYCWEGHYGHYVMTRSLRKRRMFRIITGIISRSISTATAAPRPGLPLKVSTNIE